MSGIKVTMGFVLHCKECGVEVSVGPTAFKRGSDLTFYFEPGTEAPSSHALVGVSAGSGDTFSCMGCAFPEESVPPRQPPESTGGTNEAR